MLSRAVRNASPGNLRPRSQQPAWPGQSGIDRNPGGPFAIFVTISDGWCALGLWCLDARYLRGLRTAVEMISVFAPPSENKTANYAAGVAARVGRGELDLTNHATLKSLCQAIAHWEDSQAAWSELELDAGLQLCAMRWPAYRAARQAPALPAAPSAPLSEADILNQAELDRLKAMDGS